MLNFQVALEIFGVYYYRNGNSNDGVGNCTLARRYDSLQRVDGRPTTRVQVAQSYNTGLFMPRMIDS